MKLYVTPNSPYARMARVVVIERGLEDRVAVVRAETRAAGSAYYAINPSGRVPYLVRDDGVGMEDSALICAYLGGPSFQAPAPDAWEERRLEALARSLLDGLAVWSRELKRPEGERSPAVLAHEAARAARMVDVWEREIASPRMQAPLDLLQLTLACALGMEARNADFRWRPEHPRLCAWFERVSARPSFAATAPVR